MPFSAFQSYRNLPPVQGISYGSTRVVSWNDVSPGVFAEWDSILSDFDEERAGRKARKPLSKSRRDDGSWSSLLAGFTTSVTAPSNISSRSRNSNVVGDDDDDTFLPIKADTSTSNSINKNSSNSQLAVFAVLLILCFIATSIGYVGMKDGGLRKNSVRDDTGMTSSTEAEHDWFSSPETVDETPASVIENDGLIATISNEYSGQEYTMFPYPFLADALLMEPYRENQVTLEGFTSGCDLYYSMVLETDPTEKLHDTMTASDGIFTVTPSRTGKYVLTAEQMCVDYQTTRRSLKQTVWVKYVRRELQSLTDQDREEFLDAFRTLWEVSTSDGMVTYGERYKSLFYLAMVHNDAGGNPTCDEFHAGTGFLNNHVFLSMYLEQSLRLINPKVSLHYMEYTKYFSTAAFSNHVHDQMDGGNWTEMLSAKWFGRNDPLTGIILDGRWAKSSIPYVTNEFLSAETIQQKSTWFPNEEEEWLKASRTGPHIYSPYGLLRAPWNYNPAPFTTRYTNVNRLDTSDFDDHEMKPYLGSTCEDLKIFIRDFTIAKPLQVYLESTEDNIHGYIHFTFAGSGGDPAFVVDKILQNKYGLSNLQLFYISESSHKFAKSFLAGVPLTYPNPLNCSAAPFRSGMLRTTAEPNAEGGPACQCNSYYFESEIQLNQLIELFFNHFLPLDDSLLQADFETKKEIMQLACGRMSYEGDMAGSGAATDPLFWVAHGAVERLFQRVVFDNVLSDLSYKSSKRGATCSGHEATGTKKWLRGLYLEDESVDVSTLSNAELIEILNPTTELYRDLMNTVFDDSTWSWCDGFEDWITAGASSAEEVTSAEGGEIEEPTHTNDPNAKHPHVDSSGTDAGAGDESRQRLR